MTKYLLNQRIAVDLFDGDFILANLDTGIYYSLTGLAVYLVSKLPFESQENEIEKISSLFKDESSIVNEDLKIVWDGLIKEEIIVSRTEVKDTIKVFKVDLPIEFIPSKLSKYADMQDLLMLDPIHEVDEDGWSTTEEMKRETDK